MFTLVGSLLLKQMQHNVYFGKKSPIKKNESPSGQIINHILHIKIKKFLWQVMG